MMKSPAQMTPEERRDYYADWLIKLSETIRATPADVIQAICVIGAVSSRPAAFTSEVIHTPEGAAKLHVAAARIARDIEDGLHRSTAIPSLEAFMAALEHAGIVAADEDEPGVLGAGLGPQTPHKGH
jgi:hypothetical protein